MLAMIEDPHRHEEVVSSLLGLLKTGLLHMQAHACMRIYIYGLGVGTMPKAIFYISLNQ